MHNDQNLTQSADSLLFVRHDANRNGLPYSNRDIACDAGRYSGLIAKRKDGLDDSDLEGRVAQLEKALNALQPSSGIQTARCQTGTTTISVVTSDAASESALAGKDERPRPPAVPRQYVRPKEFKAMLEEPQDPKVSRGATGNQKPPAQGEASNRGDLSAPPPPAAGGGGGGSAAGGARGRWYEMRTRGFTDEFRGYMTVRRGPCPHMVSQAHPSVRPPPFAFALPTPQTPHDQALSPRLVPCPRLRRPAPHEGPNPSSLNIRPVGPYPCPLGPPASFLLLIPPSAPHPWSPPGPESSRRPQRCRRPRSEGESRRRPSAHWAGAASRPGPQRAGPARPPR